MSLRHAGHMHHLGIGVEHHGKRVLALIDQNTVTIIHLDTAEIIAANTINIDRNEMKAPGRWPGFS